MRQNTFLIPTSFAGPAARSKRSRYSIERTPGRLGDGHGTVTALNAGVQRVENIVQGRGMREMRAFVSGVKAIRKPQHNLTQRNVLSKNTAFHQMTLTQCDNLKGDGARFATAKPSACSLITATPKGTSERSYAKHAIPSLVGMSARQALSSNSKDTWNITACNQPCHADVLLRLANEPHP